MTEVATGHRAAVTGGPQQHKIPGACGHTHNTHWECRNDEPMEHYRSTEHFATLCMPGGPPAPHALPRKAVVTYLTTRYC